MASKPIVGIITNELVNFNGRQISHSTGKRYVTVSYTHLTLPTKDSV